MKIQRFGGDGRVSTAVIHNGVLYLTSQKPDILIDDVKEQAKSIFDRIDKLLAMYGTDKNSILTANVYLKNIGDYAAFNGVWDEWVQDGFEPARTCVEAKLPIEEYLVCVSVTAAVD